MANFDPIQSKHRPNGDTGDPIRSDSVRLGQFGANSGRIDQQHSSFSGEKKFQSFPYANLIPSSRPIFFHPFPTDIIDGSAVNRNIRIQINDFTPLFLPVRPIRLSFDFQSIPAVPTLTAAPSASLFPPPPPPPHPSTPLQDDKRRKKRNNKHRQHHQRRSEVGSDASALWRQLTINCLPASQLGSSARFS